MTPGTLMAASTNISMERVSLPPSLGESEMKPSFFNKSCLFNSEPFIAFKFPNARGAFYPRAKCGSDGGADIAMLMLIFAFNQFVKLNKPCLIAGKHENPILQSICSWCFLNMSFCKSFLCEPTQLANCWSFG